MAECRNDQQAELSPLDELFIEVEPLLTHLNDLSPADLRALATKLRLLSIIVAGWIERIADAKECMGA